MPKTVCCVMFVFVSMMMPPHLLISQDVDQMCGSELYMLHTVNSRTGFCSIYEQNGCKIVQWNSNVPFDHHKTIDVSSQQCQSKWAPLVDCRRS
jgi:hypothetical protein